MPRMTTKQTCSILLGPFLDNLDDTQARTLQAGFRRAEERKNGTTRENVARQPKVLIRGKEMSRTSGL